MQHKQIPNQAFTNTTTWQLHRPFGCLKWLVTGAATCAVTLAASAATLVSQYFPMNNGDSFYSKADWNSYTYTTWTTASGTFAGRSVFVLSDDLNGVHRYYGYSGSSVVVYGMNMSGETLTFSTPLTVVDESLLASGGSRVTTATVTVQGITANVRWTSTVTSAGTVTVPAGTFLNCKLLTVDLYIEAQGQGQSLNLDVVTLAPGVGVIKRRALDQNLNPLGWLELVSGVVNGTQISGNADTTPPSLTVSSPQDHATVSGGYVSVSGTASDGSLGNSGITRITVNGATAYNGTASGSGTAYWYATVYPGAGVQTITVTATDGAGNSTTRAITISTDPGWQWKNPYGWLWSSGSGWYHHNGFGWMWFSSGQWIWSGSLQGWVATMNSTSRALWSPQFRWLTPSESDPYRADTTAIGAIYIGQYNGSAITEGWVVSDRFGYMWAAGDGKWFYSNTYGWLGVTEGGGIWCVNQGNFL